MENDFLKNIDSSQIRELVEAMYSRNVAKDEFVILENDVGSHLFVSAEGEFEVVKDEKSIGIMGAGKAFGELAILYNCKRTASIRGRSIQYFDQWVRKISDERVGGDIFYSTRKISNY